MGLAANANFTTRTCTRTRTFTYVGTDKVYFGCSDVLHHFAFAVRRLDDSISMADIR